MAIKRKKKPAKSKHKKKTSSKSILKNERVKFILGVLVLFISAYLLIAFVSFIFYGAADQSKFDIKWSELVFNSDVKVQNKAGKTGAYLAEVIMNRGFGIASFIFIYMLVISAIKTLNKNLVKLRKNFVYSLIILVWLSVAFGLIFTKTDGASSIYLGGRYGFFMSNWLSSLIGVTGLVFLLLITALIIVVTRFENAFYFIKGLVKKKENIEDLIDDGFGEQTFSDEPVVDNTISKRIDEDDIIHTIFEPDSFSETDNETTESVKPEVKNEDTGNAADLELGHIFYAFKPVN